jgi:hypothetical protein
MEKQYGSRTIKYMYYVEQLSPNQVCKIGLEYAVCFEAEIWRPKSQKFLQSAVQCHIIIIPEMIVGFGSKEKLIWSPQTVSPGLLITVFVFVTALICWHERKTLFRVFHGYPEDIADEKFTIAE